MAKLLHVPSSRPAAPVKLVLDPPNRAVPANLPSTGPATLPSFSHARVEKDRDRPDLSCVVFARFREDGNFTWLAQLTFVEVGLQASAAEDPRLKPSKSYLNPSLVFLMLVPGEMPALRRKLCRVCRGIFHVLSSTIIVHMISTDSAVFLLLQRYPKPLETSQRYPKPLDHKHQTMPRHMISDESITDSPKVTCGTVLGFTLGLRLCLKQVCGF